MESPYLPIIGMEVHVQLKTASKMFSSAANNPDETQPNKNINEVDLGHPGTLPVPNETAIRYCVMIGTALGCSIREVSKFDRKHYFYPDLPKGYQISQYDEPIAEHGELTLFMPLEETARDVATIGIERAHLEEDTAKLFHDPSGDTLVDFNRAGVPLVEIVTRPDFQSAVEAKVFCQELQLLLRALGVSDAEMEKGHMRCEANVSVQQAGSFEIVDGEVRPLNGAQLNPKVEVKNINSFKAVERAIAFEIERQTALIEAGESWVQQTRGWNEDTGETVLQRIKETAADYRYFPEPDIPPFHPAKIAGDIRLPELPIAKRQRFRDEYGFSYADAYQLTSTPGWPDVTEAVMSEVINWLYALPEVSGESDEIKEERKAAIARTAGGWLTSKLVGQLNERGMTIADLRVSPENMAELIALVYAKRVNNINAGKILAHMLDAQTDIDPTHIMEEYGYGQVSDASELDPVLDQVITEYPAQVEQFKNGKDPIIKFLIGMVMKATEGSADPVVVEERLREKLR